MQSGKFEHGPWVSKVSHGGISATAYPVTKRFILTTYKKIIIKVLLLVSFLNVSKIAFVSKGILPEFRTTNAMPRSTTRKHFVTREKFGEAIVQELIFYYILSSLLLDDGIICFKHVLFILKLPVS